MATLAPTCCGPQPEPTRPQADEADTACCDTPSDSQGSTPSETCCDTTVPTPDSEGCCPTSAAEVCCTAESTTVATGLTSLDDATVGLDADAGTWPYLHPAWLKATEEALPGAKPWHSTARRGQDALLLPGFVFDVPSLVDVDPRTFLGWKPASGESACCSVTTSCCGATTDVEAIGQDAFFPSLVLGSPIGYRSEAVGATGDALLLADLLDQALPAARAAGFRTVVAPWVADLPDNEALLLALKAHGATVSFWGEENVLTLVHDSYDAHLASLRARKRRKLRDDHAKALASGVEVVRTDGRDLLPLADRIAELTGINRSRYDGSEGPGQIRTLLTAMIESGADVRAYLGYLDGDIVASMVTFRQGKRLFVKWAGFDYDAIGERSGLYFELTFDRPLRDAYAENLQALEAGPGSDHAKRLRGCLPRAVHTALLVTDQRVAPKAAELQTAFGQARREALGAQTGQDSVTGKLRSVFGGGPKAEPIKPIQPEGGCCG